MLDKGVVLFVASLAAFHLSWGLFSALIKSKEGKSEWSSVCVGAGKHH